LIHNSTDDRSNADADSDDNLSHTSRVNTS